MRPLEQKLKEICKNLVTPGGSGIRHSVILTQLWGCVYIFPQMCVYVCQETAIWLWRNISQIITSFGVSEREIYSQTFCIFLFHSISLSLSISLWLSLYMSFDETTKEKKHKFLQTNFLCQRQQLDLSFEMRKNFFRMTKCCTDKAPTWKVYLTRLAKESLLSWNFFLAYHFRSW